jgi:predicted metal-dependent HD superfamily phosphohydrolase
VSVNELLQAWRDIFPASAPAAAVARIGDDLLARWHEPQRYYHTAEHLQSVLWVIEEQAATARDLDAVRLAAWYHDAVYDPRRVDNEEASALLAEATLPELDVEPARVAEVARLVRLTASHDPMPGDRNGGLITDADLAILAATPEAYRTYTVAIRREYAHVPEAAFVAGRTAVLRTLLDLPWLFHTPVLKQRWEEPARANITAELATLRSNPTPFASI